MPATHALEVFLRERNVDFRVDAPIALLTTFRCGGPAHCLIQPRDPEETSAVLTVLREAEVPYRMLGGGA